MLVEGRVPITRKLGIVAFGGVGCQFGDDIAGQKINCYDHTPSVGAGFLHAQGGSFGIDPIEIAGKNDNEGYIYGSTCVLESTRQSGQTGDIRS